MEHVVMAIAVLNRIHKEDPAVLPALIQMRVPCNRALADDETVQVGVLCTMDHDGHESSREFEVGFLGILNGIFGIKEDGYGYIQANFDDAGNLTHFSLS